ncbi:MAG: S8 family serine peptidase [Bacteroidetes bacterium]|nr:S8 family serine peptidase [Bacteroidota bacterium]
MRYKITCCRIGICLLVLLFYSIPNIAVSQTEQQANIPAGLYVWVKPESKNAEKDLYTILIQAGIRMENLLVQRASKIDEEPLNRIYKITGYDLKSEVPIMQILRNSDMVQLVEKVPVYHLFYAPNDIHLKQWALAQIRAEQAWNLNKGGKGVVLAIVDSGIDTTHSDLQKVLWHNKKEIKNNGIDDDGNGYKDDWFGWDAGDVDNNPHVIVTDTLDHGTHCAGIAGASTDNNNGIASIGFNIQIMNVKIAVTKDRSLSGLFEGVEYAIINKARVISMSWGGPDSSESFQALYDYAYKKGIVCVAAAGNEYTDDKIFPAAYNHVISVGATDNQDKKAYFSQYGKWVDVMAPGMSIYSTLPGGKYGSMDGTSMSCPMVAGLCALMISKNPSVSVNMVESCLKGGCVNIDSKNPAYKGMLGVGRIDAYNSLNCIKDIYAKFSLSKTRVCTGDTVQFTDQSTYNPILWKWEFTGGTPATSFIANPVVRYNTAGTYAVKLIVSNGSVTDTMLMNALVSVGKPTATFSGNQTIEKGDYGTIKVDFTGVGPWNLVYTDGKSNFTVNGVQNTPYFILLKPDTTKIFTPISVSENGCTGSVFQTTKIVVLPPYSPNCDSALRFVMRFGGTNDDQALGLSVVADTLCYIVGKTKSYGAGDFDAFIAKVSLSGKMHWLKTIGGTKEEGFLCVANDNLGNIYAGGYSYSNTSSRASFMAKYDKDGNLKWKRNYNNGSLDYIYRCLISADQKYIYFTGHSISNSFGSEDYTVYKVDSAGNMQWAKQFGDNDLNRNFTALEDKNTDLYIGGGTGFPKNESLLLKLDASGKITYAKKYVPATGTWVTIFLRLLKWDDKHFYGFGVMNDYTGGSTQTQELFAAKIDYSGNVVFWNKYTIGTGGFSDAIRIGDKFILTGPTNSKSGDGFLLQIDSSGNLLKSELVGASATERVNAIYRNYDDGVYYAGSESGTGNNQIYFGRMGCSLKGFCHSANATVSVTSVSINVSSVTYSSQNFTATQNPSFTQSSYTPSISYICKSKFDSTTKRACKLKADFEIRPTCTGKPVEFTDKSVDNAGYNLESWQWDFGDGSVGSGANITHKYKNNGIDTVTLVVLSRQGKFTCLDTATKIYFSSDSFRITKMLPDTMICIGDSVRIGKMQLDCGEDPYFYFWTPNEHISSITSSSPFFAPRKKTTYYVNITDFHGNVAYDSVTISVNTNCCSSWARFIIDKENICSMDSIQFLNVSIFNPGATFEWKFTGANISSYKGFQPPKVVFSGTGKQTITLIMNDFCRVDTAVSVYTIYRTPVAFAGNDTAVCFPDTLELGGFALGRNVYTWSPGSGLSSPGQADPTAYVNAPIQYILKVKSDRGCIAMDTINISSNKSNLLNIGRDTSICETDSILLKSNLIAAEYQWNTGEKTAQIIVLKSGNYWLETRTGNCFQSDSIEIISDSVPYFKLSADTILCNSNLPLELIPLSEKVNSGTYLWEDSSTNRNHWIANGGAFWLQRSNGACVYSDTIIIRADSMPVVTLGPDTAICEPLLPYRIPAITNASNYQWDDGTLNISRTVSGSGIYWLEAKSGVCINRDSIQLKVDISPTFSLGNDTIICAKNIPYVLNPQNVKIPISAYLWDDSSTGKSRNITDIGKYYLRMTNGKCAVSDSIFFDTLATPWVLLPNDTTICLGDTLRVSSPVFPTTSYLWNNGKVTNDIDIIQGGKYLVQLVNKCGSTSDEIVVKDKDCSCPVHVPNSFSPGRSPGLNDSFSVVWDCPVDAFKVMIYNRWGNLVFESTNPFFKWDGNVKGERVPNGSYYCIMKIKSRYENQGREFMRSGYIYITE